MDPDPSPPAPQPAGAPASPASPASPTRRVRPPRRATRGFLITGLVIGLFVLFIGIVGTVQGPASTPACNGVDMSPSDTCVQTTYVDGQVSGTQTFTSDEMLASQQSLYSTSPWWIVVGAVVTAACGWGEYRWRRNRALYRAMRSGLPV